MKSSLSKIFFLFFSTILFLTGCNTRSTSHLMAINNFDQQRFLGTWYELARYDHAFERDMSFVKAEYSANDDGTIKVINSGIKKDKLKQIVGKAKFKGESNIGHLQVSFFWLFYSDYKIIYMDENYSLAIVTSSTMDYLWILSKQPTINHQQIDFIDAKIKELGFDESKLIWVNQFK